MFRMTDTELDKLFRGFPALRIGVIGDFALDCYWTIEPAAALPSVETGKPTRPVLQQRYAAGAAGNVAADLAALGCGKVAVFGVIGEDPWGAELKRILDNLNTDITGLICQTDDWATVAYVKPHINGTEQSRIDFGDFNRLYDSTAGRLLTALGAALPELDAVVINAQARCGIHSNALRRGLQDLIAAFPEKIFTVDSREPETMYPGGILKINNIELAKVCACAPEAGGKISREHLLKVLAEFHAQRGQPVFVTCGAQGITVCDSGGTTEVPAVEWEGEMDTTGAGDAAMAAITAALAAGATPAQAAFTGNLAAGVCIRKLHQTGTASPEEMRCLKAGERLQTKAESGTFEKSYF